MAVQFGGSPGLPLSGGTLTGGLTVALGTITADQQNFSGTATWNNAAVTFTALKINVTSTASAAASLLADFQLAGTSIFKIGKADVTVANNIVFTGAASGMSSGAGSIATATWDLNYNRAGFNQVSIYPLGWSASSSNLNTIDTGLSRGGAAGLVKVGNGTANDASGSMAFTGLTLTGVLTVPGVTTAALTSTGTFTSGAGAQAGTLTNAPAAGNPTSWIKIVDNGVTRYIPAW